MNLETALIAQSPAEWIVAQGIVFDWYDGPREGVVWLESPKCEFSFKLLSEQPTPDDLDDRLFRISELPQGTVAGMLSAIRTLGEPPAGTVWAPVWRFASDRERITAEKKIHELLGKQRETDVVIWSRDMKEFLGCWQADRNGTPDSNWFAKLGIAQKR